MKDRPPAKHGEVKNRSAGCHEGRVRERGNCGSQNKTLIKARKTSPTAINQAKRNSGRNDAQNNQRYRRCKSEAM